MLFFVAGLMVFNACKEDEVFERTRLFQPVLQNEEGLMSVENTIIVEMGKMKEAESYIVEVSRDSFVTTDYSFEVDTNYFVIDEARVGEELLWFTIYQIRVTAIADSDEFDSKPSLLGSVRTQKFPSNQGVPTQFDILDTRAKVFWTPIGQPITTVKVFSIDDLRLDNPLSVFDVSDEERDSSEVIVTDLEPETQYQIAIYSGDEIRGWEIYTTRAALEFGDSEVIDLTVSDTLTNLSTVLANAPDGAFVLLDGAVVYEASGYVFSGGLNFVAGYSFVQSMPTIDCSSNFNIEDGATIGDITFTGISFKGDFGSNYVFNLDLSGSIDKISFESCTIHSLRGVMRMKGGEGTLGEYRINDCVVDSIQGYGVMTVDIETWSVGDFILSNSTFHRCQSFLVSRSASNSITIDACTIHEAPEEGRQIFRWRGGAGNDDVANGVKIHNTIWGHGWNMADEEDYGIKGTEGMANTVFDIKNTYATSLFSMYSNEIPAMPSFLYDGLPADLWADPINSDFNIIDNAFQGKGDSGDPRWRVGL